MLFSSFWKRGPGPPLWGPGGGGPWTPGPPPPGSAPDACIPNSTTALSNVDLLHLILDSRHHSLDLPVDYDATSTYITRLGMSQPC